MHDKWFTAKDHCKQKVGKQDIAKIGSISAQVGHSTTHCNGTHIKRSTCLRRYHPIKPVVLTSTSLQTQPNQILNVTKYLTPTHSNNCWENQPSLVPQKNWDIWKNCKNVCADRGFLGAVRHVWSEWWCGWKELSLWWELTEEGRCQEVREHR